MKSQFFGNLNVEHIEGKWWRLTKPLAYYSEKYDVTICGPVGFVTDLSSVPRLPLAYWLAGGTGNWESIPHDVGYRFGLCERWKLDYIYYESGRVRTKMREDQNFFLNIGRWLRTAGMAAVVAAFGWMSFNSKPGCLDYRKKCDNTCENCKNYYPLWEQCISKGYQPEISKIHEEYSWSITH